MYYEENATLVELQAAAEKKYFGLIDEMNLQIEVLKALPLKRVGYVFVHPSHQDKAKVTVYAPRLSDVQMIVDSFGGGALLPLGIRQATGAEDKTEYRIKPAAFYSDGAEFEPIAPFYLVYDSVFKARVIFYANLQLKNRVIIGEFPYTFITLRVDVQITEPTGAEAHGVVFYAENQYQKPSDVFGDSREENTK